MIPIRRTYHVSKLGYWKMACTLPDDEDILANPLAHLYSEEVNEALQPHFNILVALMEWEPGQATHLSPESVPVLTLVEA